VLPPYGGDTEAQFEFAEQYYEEYGVSQVESAKISAIHQAVKWWEMAAERGYAPAQNRLGWAYSNGEGVPKDFVKAHMWLTLAWETNNGLHPVPRTPS
jgi:TPR repeat protein